MLWERRERDFRTHQAVASVATGLAVTLPDLRVAVNPGEAWQTGAGIAALACVHARGPVGTGLVVCAVVQICKQMGGNLNFTDGATLTLFPCHLETATHLGRKRCLPSLPCRCTATALYRYHVCRRDGLYTRRKRGPASPLCICLQSEQ